MGSRPFGQEPAAGRGSIGCDGPLGCSRCALDNAARMLLPSTSRRSQPFATMNQPLLFTPITIKDVTFKNRIVIAPMATYSAIDGIARQQGALGVDIGASAEAPVEPALDPAPAETTTEDSASQA